MAMRESPPQPLHESLRGAFQEERGLALVAVFPEAAGLFEAFRVWSLDAQDVRKRPGATLAELAKQTEEWHYQVYPMDPEGRLTDGPPGHLRCAPGVGEPEVLAPMASVPESLLARKLRATLPGIEKRYPGADALVRLVEVPELSLFALWLSQGPNAPEPLDRVLVVHAPEVFSDLEEADTVEEALEAGGFLASLRRQDRVTGFVLRDSPPGIGPG